MDEEAELPNSLTSRATGSVIFTSSRSHRATELEVTPICMANACCVSPSRFRIPLNSAPFILDLYGMYNSPVKRLLGQILRDSGGLYAYRFPQAD